MGFLSRKFILSALVIVATLLKQFLGIDLTDSQLEQVADALVILGTVIGYVFAEAKVDAAREQTTYLPVPVYEPEQGEEPTQEAEQ